MFNASSLPLDYTPLGTQGFLWERVKIKFCSAVSIKALANVPQPQEAIDDFMQF